VENILPPANPNANLGDYAAMRRSFDWTEVEKEFSWHRTGRINIAYEAVDRHAQDPIRGRKSCLVYDNGAAVERINYHQMRALSNKFANVLRKLGMEKGDTVCIFLPRCPEYYIAMVGCAKVGAIFCPLFEALMERAAGDRIADSGAKVLVTTPQMAARVPSDQRPDVRTVILVGAGDMAPKAQELSWKAEMARVSDQCDIEWVDLEDPLYVIYTSDPTGEPRGVVHVHHDMIGYLTTARWVLDLREDDVLWTTAEPGWITGTVYGAFAPWLCGVENLVRGGKFDMEGWCKSIQLHRITVWYTAPTVLRRFMTAGEELVKRYNLRSLRHILSVGEPLPSEVIYWCRRVFGVPPHDTWWMTETGMILIANYPSMPIKPGSIGKPLPGVRAAVVDSEGQELPPLTLGELAIQKGWPAMMRAIWRNEAGYREYFPFESWYVSGDTAYVDDDGYFYFQGRDDDLIKVAAVVVAPSEIEDAIREHTAVADAGVIGKFAPLHGNVVKAFISLHPGFSACEDLKQEIREFVRTHFSPRMVPHEMEFRPEIPRSEDGKVIRRVLKAWDLGLPV